MMIALRDSLKSHMPLYLSLTIIASVAGYKYLQKEEPKAAEIVSEKEQEDCPQLDQEEKINSDDSEKYKKSTKKPKQSKKKDIQQRINQKTKRQFQTDVEEDILPPQQRVLQPKVTVDKNQADDKLFFQIYNKITREESNEES